MAADDYNYGPPVLVVGSGTPAVTTGEVENGGSNGGSPHTPPANAAVNMPPGGSPSKEWLAVSDPTITTLTPATGLSGAARAVTVTGTNFATNSVVEQDHVPVATTYVSKTSLTTSLQKAAAGAVTVTVRNPTGEQESNNSTFTFT